MDNVHILIHVTLSFLFMVTGRFAPSSVRPWTFYPKTFRHWTIHRTFLLFS